MTKIGHIKGYYEVSIGRGPRDDVIEETDFRQFHYVAEPGVLSETGPWTEARDRAYVFAAEKKKEGWRYAIYHHQTHLLETYGGPRK